MPPCLRLLFDRNVSAKRLTIRDKKADYWIKATAYCLSQTDCGAAEVSSGSPIGRIGRTRPGLTVRSYFLHLHSLIYTNHQSSRSGLHRMARLLWTYGALLMVLLCSAKGNQFELASTKHALPTLYSERALPGLRYGTWSTRCCRKSVGGGDVRRAQRFQGLSQTSAADIADTYGVNLLSDVVAEVGQLTSAA